MNHSLLTRIIERWKIARCQHIGLRSITSDKLIPTNPFNVYVFCPDCPFEIYAVPSGHRFSNPAR